MNQYLEMLKAELTEQKIKYEYTDVHTLMEHLWRSYTESNPISSNRLRELNAKLDPFLNSLSVSDSDKLFLAFWEFCTEYERTSFLEGLRVGARLVLELYGNSLNN